MGGQMNDKMMQLDTRQLHIAIPADHKGGPIPLLIKHAHDVEPNCWAMPDGSAVYIEREWAEKSAFMKTEEYRDNIRKRQAASSLVRAVVVENYDGWVTTTGDEDDYAEEVAALLEKHGDRLAWAGVADADIPAQLPAWAYCCTEDGFDFDLEERLECYLQDSHHESARDMLVDEKELFEFWTAWSAKQTLKSYYIDHKRIVVIDRPRYEAELAAAKAYLVEVA